MKRCSNCFMPDSKPGVVLNSAGVCQACLHQERKADTDWTQRFQELRERCDKHRRNDGYYDCIIAVSGGKDSHYQTYVMKKIMGMNPLLVSANDPFSKTDVGLRNIRNIREAFGCDMITLDLNPELCRKLTRITFESLGRGAWPVDRAIYAYPLIMGIRMGIPLIVYGENVSVEYGGIQGKETCSAKDQIHNTVSTPVDFELFYKAGIHDKELNFLKYPTTQEMDKAGLDPIYLSYFVNWDGYHNYEIAKRFGFRDIEHEWHREGFIEHYDQVDTIGYLVDEWLKYPKMGLGRATSVVGYWIRSGRITKEEGVQLIRKHDHKLDQRMLDDFLAFTGYTDEEFWNIVEKFWNSEIFDCIDGVWTMKKEYRV